MPILLVIFLVAACAPVAWPEPPFDCGARAAATIMLVALLLPAAAHLALGHWAITALRRDPSRRGFVARRFSRFRRLIGLSHFALSIAAVALGWGWLVWDRFTVPVDGQRVLAPFAELLVPLPFLTGVFLGWIIHHGSERMLHLSHAGEQATFWSRPAHFLHRFRQFALFALFPLAFWVCQQSMTRFAPEAAQSTTFEIALLVLMPALFLLMPLAIKPALGWRTLAGPIRDRFDITAKRVNFRCADLLYWPTHGTMVNAMVLGVLPRARYVVFSDRLLETFDEEELEAVFGHEIGHVRHGHLLYYAAFLLLSMMVIALAVVALAEEAMRRGWLSKTQAESNWLLLLPLTILAGYLFLVFGFLSRKCERQADLYGAHTVASGRTEGHPQAAGVYAMTRALTKVAALSGLDDFAVRRTAWYARLWSLIFVWTHGSIADRVEFLNRTLDEPGLERRAQRRIGLYRWLLMLALVLAMAALGYKLGWVRLAGLL